MIRVAAIDCGTNSIRLLVADVDVAAGTLPHSYKTYDGARVETPDTTIGQMDWIR